MGFGKFASFEGCPDADAAIINDCFNGQPIVIYGQKVGPTVVFKPLRQTQGKYYYECKTVLGGHMQIGWADDNFKADAERGKGCGDENHSWAFDGHRALIWHAGVKTPIEAKWKAGDIIGIAVNLDSKEISFSLNGKWDAPVTVFKDIAYDGGLYPCFSILYGERIEMFFGTNDNPFNYDPPSGYHALKSDCEVTDEVTERKYTGPSQIIELGLSEQSTDSNFVGAMLVTQMRKTLLFETKKNALVQHGYECALNALEHDSVHSFATAKKLSDDEILSVITYTLEQPPVYNYLNGASRKGTAVNNFPIMFYILSEACKKINFESGQGVVKQVYRGMGFKCTAKVGQQIRFGSFTSTTGNLEVANGFRTEDGTMFHIKTRLGACIKDISEYPDEDEVLIPPFEKFKVDSIDESGSTIHVTSTLSEEDISSYFKVFIQSNF